MTPTSISLDSRQAYLTFNLLMPHSLKRITDENLNAMRNATLKSSFKRMLLRKTCSIKRFGIYFITLVIQLGNQVGESFDIGLEKPRRKGVRSSK